MPVNFMAKTEISEKTGGFDMEVKNAHKKYQDLLTSKQLAEQGLIPTDKAVDYAKALKKCKNSKVV